MSLRDKLNLMNPTLTPQHIGTLVPRRYQEEVFRRARQDNIIAALDTGSGKTFISLLLIKWIAAQETHENKVIIFLVPRVALVHQQGDYIAKHTSLRVIKLFGVLNLSDRDVWRQQFRNHDVFVMTAQIFLNILTHSLWSIDKVSLMVFDECHHARKNHPYNGILRECSQVKPVSKRPKIFGMTASPIWDPKNPVKSLELLEANMGAKVVGVIENYSELQDHSPRPIEIVVTYEPPPSNFDFPVPSIYTCIKVFEDDLRDFSDLSWCNTEGRYHVTLYSLGPYCASLFLHTELLHHMMRSEQSDWKTRHLQRWRESIHTSSDATIIQDILQGFSDFFPKDPQESISLSVPLSWCTPKVKALVEVLLSHYSGSFQSIIFVEQRQVAACLARLLPAIPELSGKIRSGHFVGEGVNSEGLSSSMGANIFNSLKAFRNGEINTLVTTAVAEEGLDFPACDLVVRFDSLQHMVGYIQSRGRARNRTSIFVMMVQENDVAQLARYKALKEGEPQVAAVYLSRAEDMDIEDESDEELTPSDLTGRERYVVPKTGAILNYDNAIGLLNRLCALIPTDAYTPAHKPIYSGDFAATLRLPSNLPLSPDHLVYHGPSRRTKKEAKRAVAFLAARRLRELDVLDEYLLPVPPVELEEQSSEDTEDNMSFSEVKVPVIMDVMVRDPWVMGHRLWIHEVAVNGCRVAGLVAGTRFSPGNMRCLSISVEIGVSYLVKFSDEDETHQRRAMEEYTKLGIHYRLTGAPIWSGLSVFLVPITSDGQPDFEAIDRLLINPRGSYDWSSVGEDNYDRLLVTVNIFAGRTYRLRRLRHDISPMSAPMPGSREAGSPSYRDYLAKRCKAGKVPVIPTDGPMVELVFLPRTCSAIYDLKNDNAVTFIVRDGGLFPVGCCRWLDLSFGVCQAFELLPAICHRLTDIYRSSCLRSVIGLPPIDGNLLAEALTLPSAHAGYNNQRLETLGDAVLQFCTTVHLFNCYPRRHEGQLTSMRRTVVCNRFLSARALSFGLETFLTNEAFMAGRWMHTLSENNDRCISAPVRYVKRDIPRRSLQDCVEAILGASFLTGGISTALRAGKALGLSFWGAETCYMLPKLQSGISFTSPYFVNLEDSLGYKFFDSQVLLEAVTHPSFSIDSGGRSYQRLEFLGDAILSLVVMEYLYARFVEAKSYPLSLFRAKLVCNTALAWVAVKRLELHKILLANSVNLNTAINQYVPVLEAASAEDIVETGWRYDPPKALSDVFESLIGAIFVDSAYNYEKTATVVLLVMEDLLGILNLNISEDPVSRLLTWAAGQGCRKVAFEKVPKIQGEQKVKGMTITVHDRVVAGPIFASSRRVARFEASNIAIEILKNETGKMSLGKLCTCKRKRKRTGKGNRISEELAEEQTVVKIFLAHLKSIFPAGASPNPWFLVAAVAFSASNRPEEVPRVLKYAIKDAQTEQEKTLIAKKVREGLIKAGLTSGYSRSINSLKALYDTVPELRPTDMTVLRNVNLSLQEYEKLGRETFAKLYGETAQGVQAMLDTIYPDMGWFSKTIGYGLMYGFTDILSNTETSYTLVASLISMDTAQQIIWHLANARRAGATVAEIRAVRDIAMEVGRETGIEWRNGVPEVDE
ncbi:hypothetical protein APHAL10511_007137 [Amanita phalloides]|nr:hypothetical protein APHAL10511_007137 [Amanita phalloides]